MSTRYCIIGEHAIEHGSASCAARAKTLHPVGSSHESGVRHAQHDGSGCLDRNAEGWLYAVTAHAISSKAEGRRKDTLPEGALLLVEAMRRAGAKAADVAAALDKSERLIRFWTYGQRSIPSDIVLDIIRRVPRLGLWILALCAAELPEKDRSRLPGLIDEAVEIKRKMGWSK